METRQRTSVTKSSLDGDTTAHVSNHNIKNVYSNNPFRFIIIYVVPSLLMAIDFSAENTWMAFCGGHVLSDAGVHKQKQI